MGPNHIPTALNPCSPVRSELDVTSSEFRKVSLDKLLALLVQFLEY